MIAVERSLSSDGSGLISAYRGLTEPPFLHGGVNLTSGVSWVAKEIVIRTEQLSDVHAVRNVVHRAYAAVPYSEHLMIERLRETDAYSPALSRLAEVNKEPIGHILLTRAMIVGVNSLVPALALAPLSVMPEHRSHGVGKRLVRAAQQRATDLGFSSILLVGIPSYYPQFGFEPLSRYPITLPFDALEANCMILPLSAHALDGVAGRVRYAKSWLDY